MKIPLGQYLNLLSRYLAAQKPRVALLFALLISGVLLQVGNPQIVRAFIDGALDGEPQSRLLVLAALFILFAAISQLLAVLATYLSETVGWTATNALRSDFAEHLLRLDMSFHKTRTPGEMIQRIDGDVDGLSNFFSQFALALCGNLLLLIGVLFFLFLEDWRLGVALGLFALLALTVLFSLRSFAVSRWIALREVTAQFYGFVGEQLAGTEDIRANGARPYSMTRFHEQLRHWLPLSISSGLGFAWLWIASLSVFTVGHTVALLASFYLWQQGDLSIGSVYLVFHYTELLRRPIEQIREQMQELQSASASIARVDGLLQIESKIRDEGRITLPDGPLAVEFEGVSFGYEPDDPVLNGVSLSVEPGQFLGLVGRTGSGKTTLGRLLVRLYDIDDGRLTLGGHPLAELPLSHLRDRVGVVSQDIQLLEGSVRNNLTFFDESIPDERLVRALDGLGLGGWLESLPDGLDTELGTNWRLSAGEAQLLAYARVFLRDPGLIVLDEATSRLDPATQRLIEVAVANLLRGRTAIVVAHRLTTLEDADVIAVMEDGSVIEAGPRQALLADQTSRFASLYRRDAEASLT
ncbi:MAG: ATP-binding cassette domain-containing protein [Dehalococcoidia bacterium]|nr:ATP-binding cassette domain-containing protein [Dehalococcoidia bacterium]